MIRITDNEIDLVLDALDCIHLLEVCSAILSGDGVTEQIAATVSHMLESISERLTANLIVLEQVCSDQSKAEVGEMRDGALLFVDDILRLQERLAALRGQMNGGAHDQAE